MRTDDGGNVGPFFLVPRLADTSTLQNAGNEKFQQEAIPDIFYAFSYMTLFTARKSTWAVTGKFDATAARLGSNRKII